MSLQIVRNVTLSAIWQQEWKGVTAEETDTN